MNLPDIWNYKDYPAMTRWFRPALLFKLLGNVIISQIFGQYADRRLMIAALDTDSKQFERTTLNPGKDYTPREDGDFWFDFVADLGDAWDPTYSIAKLLAEPALTIDGKTLPRSQLLVMGGDEVYPTASREAYQHKTRDPYAIAFPEPEKGIIRTPLYAVPGNHDWYDGLVTFLAFFCRTIPVKFGGWITRQRRSYFALKLTDKWWLWCSDIQLDDDMDAPQAEYFRLIAAQMPANSNIILCSAEPGWLYTHKTLAPYNICDFFAGLAIRFGHGLKVPIVLSGDTHHYSRYTADDGTQFITSGGGGAFLHPTHQIPQSIDLPRWLGHDRKINLNATYPPQNKSRFLLWRNFFFAFTNWDFAALVGFIYWLVGAALIFRPEIDTYIFTLAAFSITILAYTRYQERTDRLRNWIVSLINGMAHAVATYFLANIFNEINATYFPALLQNFYGNAALTLVEMLFAGGLVGATIFGTNLAITCAFLDMNSNDAFSAMRLETYKNFLRIRITSDGDVEFYPIGLKDIPRRTEWQPSADGKTYETPYPLKPELIEEPFKYKG